MAGGALLDRPATTFSQSQLVDQISNQIKKDHGGNDGGNGINKGDGGRGRGGGGGGGGGGQHSWSGFEGYSSGQPCFTADEKFVTLSKFSRQVLLKCLPMEEYKMI